MSDDFTRAMREPPVTPFSVRGVTVDSLCRQAGGRVDFIKVDVEGAEPGVFEGARATKSTNPQLAIVMEWAPGQIHAAGVEPSDFIVKLREYGLRVSDIMPDGQEEPITFDALASLPYRAGMVLRAAAAS